MRSWLAHKSLIALLIVSAGLLFYLHPATAVFVPPRELNKGVTDPIMKAKEKEALAQACATFDESTCKGTEVARCFWYERHCLGRDDGRICPKITDKNFCGTQSSGTTEGSRVCVWKNNRCFSPLEAGLSAQYDTEDLEKRGKFLPRCALGGTCRDLNDLVELVLNYAGAVLKLIGGVAFVMFIAGGAQMILSFGNPEKFKAGQKRLFFAVIGIGLALSAFLLVNFILTALGVEPAFRAID